MKQYKLITCCGNCAAYSLKKHRCTAGAEDEGSPQDNFYADCPLKDGKPIDEKQVPKRPIMGRCANCGIDLDTWNFCPVCGQKLDWSDEE